MSGLKRQTQLMMGNNMGDRLHTMPYPATHTFAGGFSNCMTCMTDSMTNTLKIVTIRDDTQLITGQIDFRYRLFSQSAPIAMDIHTEVANSQRCR